MDNMKGALFVGDILYEGSMRWLLIPILRSRIFAVRFWSKNSSTLK